MLQKYGLQSKEQRAKIKDGKKGEVSSLELRVKPQPSEFRTPYSELNFGGCGIHIVGGLPCGRFLAVRGNG